VIKKATAIESNNIIIASTKSERTETVAQRMMPIPIIHMRISRVRDQLICPIPSNPLIAYIPGFYKLFSIVTGFSRKGKPERARWNRSLKKATTTLLKLSRWLFRPPL
jgi:hypothetical protein